MAPSSRITLTGDRFARLSLCAVLAISMSACAVTGRPEATPFPSTTTVEPVFLADETLCEAVSHQLLKTELSFQVENYSYAHKAFTNQNGENADTFNCKLYGRQSSSGGRYGLLIGYAPGRQLRATMTSYDFSTLDDDGMESVTLEGIEGRGYIWINSSSWHASAAWLYPDDHALEIIFFSRGGSEPASDNDAAIEDMRALLKELIVTIPPVAAGPDRSFTFVPNPHDPQDAARHEPPPPLPEGPRPCRPVLSPRAHGRSSTPSPTA